jgi:hypothetical protein
MIRIALIGIVHWAASVCGWYFVGASAQAAADALDAAPVWLSVLQTAVETLLFPFALLAVELAPGIRVFSMPAFAAFACVTAINSAAVVCGGWLLCRRLTKT